MAKELLSKPDGFLTASIQDKEYIIRNMKRKSSYANVDDSTIYWTLMLNKCGRGNIKRAEESVEDQT